MSRLDVDALLRRAVERNADLAGVAACVIRSNATRWASATFAGARHELVIEVPVMPPFESWLSALPEAELNLRDHLVADLKLVAVRREGQHVRATVEVLTVEER